MATGLFLETSAQISRVVGGNREVRADIDDLISRAARVSTSVFVAAEFEAVVGGLYNAVADAIGSVSQFHRPRRFDDLWSEAAELLGYHVPGGPRLLSQLIASLGVRYGSDLVTASELRAFLKGQREAVLELFFVVGGVDLRQVETLIDKSSCYVWPNSKQRVCEETPCSDCRLKETCVDDRDLFLQTIGVLANSSVDEARFLRHNEFRLRVAEHMDLLSFVGKNPNAFGDAVIFLEVPDEWRILTKDKAFKLLAAAALRKIEVYFVRPKRLSTSTPCGLLVDSAPGWAEARLVNYSSREILIESTLKLALRQTVSIDSAECGGLRRGIIRRRDKSPDGFHYGVRLHPSVVI